MLPKDTVAVIIRTKDRHPTKNKNENNK